MNSLIATPHAVVTSMMFVSVLTLNIISQPLNDADKNLAQKTAKQFVNRMLETRDVAALFPELFHADFIPSFGCYSDQHATQFYKSLSSVDKVRLFRAEINAFYLISVDLLAKKVVRKPSTKAFASILDTDVAEELRSLILLDDRPLRFASVSDFKIRMPKIEAALSKARNHLISTRIEQSNEFQNAFDNTITGRAINYRASPVVVSEPMALCGMQLPVSIGSTVYSVETPLFLGLLIAKGDNGMKILYVGHTDD